MLCNKEYRFVKNHKKDVIWWVDNAEEEKGIWLFSFDKVKVFNMFCDYPHKLTREQRDIFDKENPYWAEFFKER